MFALVDDDQRRTCLATSTISRCLPVFDQGWSVARVNNELGGVVSCTASS